MDDTLVFGSREYWLMFALIAFGRAMDFLSTWLATPNLALEGNPLAKRLGWKLGGIVNVVFCFAFAGWAVTAIIITTTSMLIASHNFRQAWLMRTMGEEGYRLWYVERLSQANLPFYLGCLFGETALIGLIGGVLAYVTEPMEGVPYTLGDLIPFAIGYGIVGYAIAVLFFTLLSVWRIRRSMR